MYFQSYLHKKFMLWPHEKNAKSHPSFHSYLEYHLKRFETGDIEVDDFHAYGQHLSLSAYKKFPGDSTTPTSGSSTCTGKKKKKRATAISSSTSSVRWCRRPPPRAEDYRKCSSRVALQWGKAEIAATATQTRETASNVMLLVRSTPNGSPWPPTNGKSLTEKASRRRISQRGRRSGWRKHASIPTAGTCRVFRNH